METDCYELKEKMKKCLEYPHSILERILNALLRFYDHYELPYNLYTELLYCARSKTSYRLVFCLPPCHLSCLPAMPFPCPLVMHGFEGSA